MKMAYVNKYWMRWINARPRKDAGFALFQKEQIQSIGGV